MAKVATKAKLKGPDGLSNPGVETKRGKAGKTGESKGLRVIEAPYIAEVTILGVEPMLCHRYDCEVVEAKSKAAKGSKEKKSDNVESYLYRGPKGEIGIPGINIKASIVEAAKFSQDPRSPRKSARDLYRAAIKIPGFSPLGKKTWDFLDRRRVVVQRNAIARVRPGFAAGWKLTFRIHVALPEYISADKLHDVLTRAGQMIGLGDFRPDFGTFQIVKFDIL
jgi:hypothetical protein